MESQATYKIITDLNPNQADDQVLRDGINAFNFTYLKEYAQHYSIFLKDDNEHVQGGVLVWAHTESIYIDVIWVAESLRGQGYGTQLLSAAEKEASRRGCRYSTVDTFSFQAEEFYLKNGYQHFGEIKNYLFEHTRIFFRKELK